MKLPLLVAASALTLAGCNVGGARAVAKLECPSSEGDLTRLSAAADGKTCIYRSSDGAEVTLRLVAVTGGVEATLAAIEKQLRIEPGAPAAAAGPEVASTAAASEEAARVLAEARADAAGDTADGEVQEVREERSETRGVTTSKDGKATRVDLPGIHIVANDEDDTAQVQVGPLHINANDDDATVHMLRDVRLRGEALSREKRGIRATFIYTGKDLPAGYRYVGYQAGGPKTGPITVATIRTKDGTESGDNINHDVEELVRRNGGV